MKERKIFSQIRTNIKEYQMSYTMKFEVQLNAFFACFGPELSPTHCFRYNLGQLMAIILCNISVS